MTRRWAIVRLSRMILLWFALPTLGGCGTLDWMRDEDRVAARGQGAAIVRIAEAARAAGDHDTAIRAYTKLTRSHPGETKYSLALGSLLLETGHPREAVLALAGAAAIDSSDPALRMALGRARLADHAPAEALDDFEAVLRSAPRDVPALINRGVALDMLGRHGEAQASYRAALAEAPRHASAKINLALSLCLAGSPDVGIALLRAVAAEPDAPPRARANLAAALWLGGKDEDAAALALPQLGRDGTEENRAFFSFVRDHARAPP